MPECTLHGLMHLLRYKEKSTGRACKFLLFHMLIEALHCVLQIVIEIPYSFVQALEFTVITYPMIGYYWSAYKVFWYFYSMFNALLYFNYIGTRIVAMTPSFQVASILSSGFYTAANLFAGYLIPQPVSYHLLSMNYF